VIESEYCLDHNVRERLVALPFIAWLLILLLTSVCSNAQGPYIYPSKGQSQAQQDKDRYECHTWAAQQTGFDPSNPKSTTLNAAASRQYQPSQPHVIRGAARGAALGAVGGAIAGDAGKGAGAGAAMGGVAGGFRRRDERRQQANAQASDTSAAVSNQRTSYNRAMAACLQGRGYTVN
jgi:Glycine-zipper domain